MSNSNEIHVKIGGSETNCSYYDIEYNKLPRKCLHTIIRPLVLGLKATKKLLCIMVAATVDCKINTTCWLCLCLNFVHSIICAIQIKYFRYYLSEALTTRTHRRTHTHLTALCTGLSRWAGTRKVKPIWILLKQETVSGSGISWAICKSAPWSRKITMPEPHHSVFYRPDALPNAQPTASKHRRQIISNTNHMHWLDMWQTFTQYIQTEKPVLLV